ncbi:zinc-finger protein, putative [Theileria annulata]|uniref:Zinc-finger protein, putative n=1 Tax=Theileria annulata TaxID=5874 RepID=Q4UAP9_THEAN|nr:zinc-finger protein, putative [Theileria annulata]CAI76102.1 zinc-finger protein, putative [Theileria annulata]|eukprot:XP_952728.1 zinc-finger protein, putative [Theileria annulata]
MKERIPNSDSTDGFNVPLLGDDNGESRFEITCYSRSCKDIFIKDKLICCTTCRKCYHSKCNKPPLHYDIVIRYPWHCNSCKICVNCNEAENGVSSTLLICDSCDRAFHMECTRSKYTEIPSGNWYCDDCQYCKSCDIKFSEHAVIVLFFSYFLWFPPIRTLILHKFIKFNTVMCIIVMNFCCVCSKSINSIDNRQNKKVVCNRCSQTHTLTVLNRREIVINLKAVKSHEFVTIATKF